MNNTITLLSIVLAFILNACSKKDPEPEPEKNNILNGTRWQTQDIAAELVYGGTCFQVIHFKDNSTHEIYSTRNGQVRKYDFEGTYTVTDKDIQIRYKDDSKDVVTNYIFINSGTFERSPKGTFYTTYLKQQ